MAMFWSMVENMFLRRTRAKEMRELRLWLQQFEGEGGVALERDDITGIATLCLDHPVKKNAINGHMMTALGDAIEILESWSSGKGLIVYGSGHNFCSGGDLDFVRQISNPSDGSKMATYMQDVLSRLRNLPMLSVAVIEGSGALGGGSEIAFACDWRLMSQDTRGIGFVHRHMGIAPAWGGATMLVQAVGYRLALELMTTGCLIDAKQAVVLGLAEHILKTEDTIQEATDWLQERTKGDPKVVRSIKKMVSNARDAGYVDTFLQERKLFTPLWGGLANQEALAKKLKHR